MLPDEFHWDNRWGRPTLYYRHHAIADIQPHPKGFFVVTGWQHKADQMRGATSCDIE